MRCLLGAEVSLTSGQVIRRRGVSALLDEEVSPVGVQVVRRGGVRCLLGLKLLLGSGMQ